MKKKLTIATFLFSTSMVMIFAAAKVETCAEKHKSCTFSCDGELQKCKLSGRPDETCEQIHRLCINKCDLAKQDCEKNKKK